MSPHDEQSVFVHALPIALVALAATFGLPLVLVSAVIR